MMNRRTWVIPALKPMKAVKWGSLVESSLGKERTFPLCFLVLFLGRNPREPCLGHLNFLCDIFKDLANIFYLFINYLNFGYFFIGF